MSKLIDLTNKRFGNLLVLSVDRERSTSKYTYWKCLCDCGSIKSYQSYNLRKGKHLSCGCKKKKLNMRLYSIYKDMKKRCLNIQHKDFQYYGGKGIAICDEWLSSFDSFEEWANRNGYSDDLTIDRIDNAKGYCPSNCRWITIHDQQQNKSNCVFYSYDNKTMNIRQWCEELNLPYHSVINRRNKILKSGKSVSFEDLFLNIKYDKPKFIPHNRKLLQLDRNGNLIKEWDSVKSAVTAGYEQSQISRCCNNQRNRKTHRGYMWRYAED